MKTKIFLSLLIVPVLLAGCVATPKTEIKGTIGDKPFKITSPKDSDIEDLKVSTETNGTCSVSIKKLKVRMNPDVVGQTAAGQAQIIAAALSGSGQLMGELLKKGLEAYFAQYGVPPAATSKSAPIPAPIPQITPMSSLATNAPAATK